MANVFDVAEYILGATGHMTAMKLELLVYYCQAWHMVWTEQPLFYDKIEAQRNGPVVSSLFARHKGHFKLHPGFFSPSVQLTKDERAVIDKVVAYYGHRDSHWLSQLAHMEDPWKNARSIHPHEDHHHNQSAEEISQSAIFAYYSSLQRIC